MGLVISGTFHSGAPGITTGVRPLKAARTPEDLGE
jgi:hypothetical protein